MRYEKLDHHFVEQFPERLEPGILYVSMEYGSVSHSCCCGCGEEIVTPLTPTDWKITYDGETISLNPSVGSWTIACRSHYVIRNNQVIEAPPWSDRQVSEERKRDRRAKARHFKPEAGEVGETVGQEVDRSEPMPIDREVGIDINWRDRFARWWRALFR